jgi:uncharacterized protein YicC (UPF0701 family)
MTGFAAARKHGARQRLGLGHARVNGKGLDLRLRVPDWIDGLEGAVRAALVKATQPRQCQPDPQGCARRGRHAEGLSMNPAALQCRAGTRWPGRRRRRCGGRDAAPAAAADVLALRGVHGQAAPSGEDTAPLRAAILADLPQHFWPISPPCGPPRAGACRGDRRAA